MSNFENLMYCSNFCEENIYLLAKKMYTELSINELHENKIFVLILSNINKSIPIWHQKANANYQLDDPCVWDYHVILLRKDSNSSVIFDFDTTLTFPCDSIEYLSKSLRPHIHLPPTFQQLIRVVDANHYLSYFASDRSHMLQHEYPFPTWSCIRGIKSLNPMTLWEFVNMDSTNEHGDIMSVQQLIEFCTT